MTITVPIAPRQRAHPSWCIPQCEAVLDGLHRTPLVKIPAIPKWDRGNRATIKACLWAVDPDRDPMVEIRVVFPAGRVEFLRFDLDLADLVELRAALDQLLTVAGKDVTP